MKVNYVCETCGKTGTRTYPNNKVPNHIFCSVPCQNEWQKTRQDIVEKNKSLEFRKKVSEGLKRRKRILGENYHSKETKKKIGEETIKHWKSYDTDKRNRVLSVLKQNAQNKRTYGPYDYAWKLLSKEIRKNNICHRCGKLESDEEHLALHHIIPVKAGGTREINNLVPLCHSCHSIVENQTKLIYRIVSDWNIVQLLVKERLHII
jgi:hypothetical protein